METHLALERIVRLTRHDPKFLTESLNNLLRDVALSNASRNALEEAMDGFWNGPLSSGMENVMDEELVNAAIERGLFLREQDQRNLARFFNSQKATKLAANRKRRHEFTRP